MKYKLIGYSDIDPSVDGWEMIGAFNNLMGIEFPVVVEPFDETDCVKVPTRMGIMYLMLESFIYEEI